MSYYKFLNGIKHKGKIEIYDDKTSKRSFTYIDDISIMIHKLIKILINKKKFLDTVNLGNNNSRSLKDLVEIIKKKTQTNFKEIKTIRSKSDAYMTASNNKKNLLFLKNCNFF